LVNITLKEKFNFKNLIQYSCRCQWPRGLRRRSAAARLLRSWVRIPPGAWMFVCCECCVLLGRGICEELITRPEEFYRPWCVVVCDLETFKKEEAMTRVVSQRQSKKKKKKKKIIIIIIIHKSNTVTTQSCNLMRRFSNQTMTLREHSYSTTDKMHLFSQIIYSCKMLSMFRTIFPSVIRR